MSTGKKNRSETILIVDDSQINARILSNMLERQGYDVLQARDGSTALMMAANELPMLILLDISMPNMDGYVVCEALKRSKKTADIPVVFISALDEVVDKIKAFSVGGVDYITKPFQLAEVLARVQTQLEIYRLRQELLEANQSLQSSNHELDAFAHTVAHDLRSPLNNIFGFSSIIQKLLKQNKLEQIHEFVDGIQRSAVNMNNIIDEIMLLAGVRRGSFNVSPLSMGSILKNVQERLITDISDSHGEIVLPDSWPEALGYAPWIEEVWANYISNGLKYGGRPYCLELGANELPNSMIRFWIQDNGKGIPEDKISSLFAEFNRLDEIKVQGHGLGLSIVRRIVEKLGGNVGVESKEGGGSCFYFTLPASKTAVPEPAL